MNCPYCHSDLPADAAYCASCGERINNVREHDNYVYEAFISYRHLPLDQAMAKKVQRVLETYRIPRGAVQGQRRRKLGKCFRDEDELSGCGNLPDRITDALKQSRKMVVICSENTSESEWVNKEIRQFCAYHGRDNVSVVLVGDASTDCLPEAITEKLQLDEDGTVHSIRYEPLATNLCAKTGKKFRLEMLRLVSAVLGCGYDDLRQRQKLRNRRKSIAIAALFALVLLAIGLLILNHHAQSVQAEREELARQSSAALERGDRLLAVQLAMDALPSEGNLFNQTVPPQVQLALENAVGPYPSMNSMAKCIYSTEGNGYAIYHLINDESGEWFATLDAGMELSFYEGRWGHLTARVRVPFDSGSTYASRPDSYNLYAIGDSLLCYCWSDGGRLMRFDPADGSLVWDLRDVGTGRCCISGDNKTFVLAELSISTEQVKVLAYDSRTGNLLQKQDVPISMAAEEVGQLNCVGCSEDGSEVYFAYGGVITSVPLDGGSVAYAECENQLIVSLAEGNGLILACSYCVQEGAEVVEAEAESIAEGDSAEVGEGRITIDNKSIVEAFDSDLNRIWAIERPNASWVADNDSLGFAPPMILSYNDLQSVVMVRLGSKLLSIDLETGNERAEFDCDDAPVALSGMLGSSEDEKGLAGLVITAGGNLGFFAEFSNEVSWLYSLGERVFRAEADPSQKSAFRVVAGSTRSVEEIALDALMFCEGYASTYPGRAVGFLVLQNCDASKTVLYTESGDGFMVSDEDNQVSLFSDYGIDTRQPGHGIAFSRVDPSLAYIYGFTEEGECILVSLNLETMEQMGSVSLENTLVDSFWGSVQDALEYVTGFVYNPAQLAFGASESKLVIVSAGMRDKWSGPGETVLSAQDITVLDPVTLDPISTVYFQQDMGAPQGVWVCGDVALMSFCQKSALEAQRTASTAVSMHLVDLSSGEIVPSDLDRYIPAGEGEPHRFVVDPQSSVVVVACDDGSLRCFDLPSGDERWSIPFRATSFDYLSMSPDAAVMLAQRGGEGCMLLDVSSGRTIGSVESGVATIVQGRFSADGGTFYAICWGGNQLTTLYAISLDRRSFGVKSRIDYVRAVMYEESELLCCDYMGFAFCPYLSLDQLVDRGRQITN